MTPPIKRTRRPPEAPAPGPAETSAASNEPPMLAAATAVCRSRNELSGLSHVAHLINAFADSTAVRWTLESVSDKGPDDESSTRLLDLLLLQEWSGRLDAEFRRARFRHSGRRACLYGKNHILDWWLIKYLPPSEDNVEAILMPAIQNSRIKVLEWLEHERALPSTRRLIISCDDAQVAYWLHERGYTLSIGIGRETRRNNLDFLKWAHEHEDRHRVCGIVGGIVGAASVNNIEMAQWFAETYPDTDWDEPDNGEYSERDPGMIKWLEENLEWEEPREEGEDAEGDEEADWDWNENSEDNHNSWIDYSMSIAANAGQLDIIQYLYDHPSHQPTCDLIFDAAMNGHLEVVKWLHGREPACSESAIAYAVDGGHLEIANWLHGQISNPIDGNTPLNGLPKKPWRHVHESIFSIDVAAEKWTLEMVQWLHESRPNECTTKAMDKAAENGKLEIVQWLHDKRSEGCTANALEGAVRNGHLEMIQWLQEHRSECKDSISPETMDLAAQEGHLDVVKWLHENRSEGCTVNAVDKASTYGHLEVVKFLLENRSEGCTTKAADEAAANGHLDIVKYLLTNRSKGCTTSAMDNAAANGHSRVVCWLHTNRSEGCTPEAINLAVNSNHVEVVKFLYEHCDLRCSEAAIKEAAKWNFAAVDWVLKHDPRFSTFKYEPSRRF